jgi:predicted dehydrogenase
VTLRIGILGAARVATYAMIAAAKEIEGVVVQAVATRDPERARAYAAEHGIPTTYANYQALIEASDVDAVYVALPPNLHAPWSIAALNAGKPVLCEKPFSLSVSDAQEMVDAEEQSGLLLMEAQHSHYHPLSARMREVVQSGVLGKINRVETAFDAPVGKGDGEIRYMPDVGGGALWDLGIYPLHWVQSALNEPIEAISAHQRLHRGGADIETIAELISQSGVAIHMSCNMDAPFRALARFIGEEGTLTIQNPLAPQHGYSFTIAAADGERQEDFSKKSSYAYQLEAFRDALLTGGSVPTRGYGSVRSIELLEQIRDLAQRQGSNDAH